MGGEEPSRLKERAHAWLSQRWPPKNSFFPRDATLSVGVKTFTFGLGLPCFPNPFVVHFLKPFSSCIPYFLCLKSSSNRRPYSLIPELFFEIFCMFFSSLGTVFTTRHRFLRVLDMFFSVLDSFWPFWVRPICKSMFAISQSRAVFLRFFACFWAL